jgi:hypothetical protein
MKPHAFAIACLVPLAIQASAQGPEPPVEWGSRVLSPGLTILSSPLRAGGTGVVLEGAMDGTSELRCATGFSGDALLVATGDLTLRHLRLSGCANVPALLISDPTAHVQLEGVDCYNNTHVEVGLQRFTKEPCEGEIQLDWKLQVACYRPCRPCRPLSTSSWDPRDGMR